ncbi:MAG: flagellar basal body-associated FliL family protein [Campylobacterota bacterium]|nr:flagellar basal body-associated FliL family protein [Campylobacterota bacterium]
MAEEEAKEESKSSGGSKGILIVLIVLVVILLGAVGAGAWYVLTQLPQQNAQDGDNAQKVEKSEADEDAKVLFKAEINDMVLNITNAKGREKLMKLSFAIKSTTETIEAIIEENRAEIIDVVIGQISARSSEELLTVGGKALLKEELLEEINRVVNDATATNEDIKKNSVKKLFFTSFVIK